MANSYLVGVDVGTGSVRAALFSEGGRMVEHSTRAVKTWYDRGHSEQSTADIWAAVCSCVQEVIFRSNIDPSSVRGVGFDATCSLAVVDAYGHPVTVSLSRDPERNVILWQDHRAVREAEEINSHLPPHPVLRYVGGKISPEMEPPKLLWLKRHLHEVCWKKAAHFFDLADYLTYRATGATSRSLCCVVCKWTYIGDHPASGSDIVHGWDPSFWRQIGLGDLADEEFTRIGTTVLPPGMAVGAGLSERAGGELGLLPGTPVATAIIDAHAGGLGMVGADLSTDLSTIGDFPLPVRLALIAGTSSCHMASSQHPIFVPGVWGPYCSAMVPGHYLNEGGQTTAGQLLDHVLHCNTDVFKQLETRATERECSVHEMILEVLRDLASRRTLPNVALLTRDLHVLPDVLGNRSPLADPTIRGMICGLTLMNSVEELVQLYLATVQALAYGTRHIIETMKDHGHQLRAILVCGGLRNNHLYIQMHADITGLPVLLTEEKEAVLMGSAILGAVAAGDNISEAMRRMTRVASVIQPCFDTAVRRFHDSKYKVFQQLYKHQKQYRELMD